MKALFQLRDPSLRQRLSAVLQEIDPAATVLVASGPDEVIQIGLREPDLDLLLLDTDLSERGVGTLARLRDALPALPAVVISRAPGRAELLRAEGVGLAGLLPSESPRWTMVGAIELILSGGIYRPPLGERFAPL